MNIEELEQKLRGLLKGEFASLHISFNDSSALNYVSVEKFETEFSSADADDWISEEERQKGYASNSKWSVQWYPDTPIGSYCVAASTLVGALEAALALTPTRPNEDGSDSTAQSK